VGVGTRKACATCCWSRKRKAKRRRRRRSSGVGPPCRREEDEEQEAAAIDPGEARGLLSKLRKDGWMCVCVRVRSRSDGLVPDWWAFCMD
jgi:hypothetical protein